MSFVSLTSVKSTIPDQTNNFPHANDHTNEKPILIERTNFLLEQKVFFIAIFPFLFLLRT